MAPKSMSIIPADQMIAVEGESYRCSFSAGDGVHAIQWFADHGQIEMSKGPAHGFANADFLDPYLEAWRKGKASALRAEHGERVVHLTALDATLASHIEALGHMKETVAQLEKQIAEAKDPDAVSAAKSVLVRLMNQVRMTTGEIATLNGSRDSLSGIVVQLDTRASQAEREVSNV